MLSVTEPCLRILEEPQNNFRFRYKSELRASHGCLLGINSAAESRTYPTVELFNYDKRALIRCRLVQHQNSDEHPHRLQVDGEEDVGKEVPESDSYRVSFRGLTIVHTARKEVADILYQECNNDNLDNPIDNELWNDCWKKAKEINKNIVRLRFSAHNIVTGREICEPVFSELIHNKKSVATNALKICRMSKLGGQPEGGEEVIMFVEKVSSADIEIHFVERNHHAGQERWFAKAEFSKDDVHHQYAIAFRTPPYRYQQIFSDVKVSVMLFRPSDESYSDPIEFSYYADPFARQAKRKAPSPSCSTSVSIQSVGCHIPDGSAGGLGSSIMNAEIIRESLNTQTRELQERESSIQDPEELLSNIQPLQTEGSTGDFVLSAMDAEVIRGPLKTQLNRQGDTTADLESHQSENAIQDFDKLWDIRDFTSTIVDLYNMEEILEGALKKDSGFGTVKAIEPLAPRDPCVISEPKVEHQSADEREDTCHGDQLEASDLLESTLSRAERFSATNISDQLYVRMDGDTVVPSDQEDTSRGDLPEASDSLESTLSSAERSFGANNSNDKVRIGRSTVVPSDQKDPCRGDASDSSDVLEGPETILLRAKRYFAMYKNETCENILILLLLCFSFVVAVCVY